jgi:DNA processing protein
MSLDRRTSLMILSALPGLGPVKIRKLDGMVPGGVERLLDMTTEERHCWCSKPVVEELERSETCFDPDKVPSELEEMGADFITFEDEAYPERLRHFGDRPVGLYRCRADCPAPTRTLAIVGTRKPTAYGRRITREFAAGLSRKGFCIISGMAEGVDTEAHRSVLEMGGLTLAVLGGGLKRCYPASNRMLMKEIMQSGGVWSEFPLWRRADRRSFPQRNRIVAGMSEAVLVIESGSTGGSLITARMASEQGKTVYVIPGRIDSPESTGCHALIRDGAQLVTTVEDILDDLNYLPGLLQATNEHRKGISKPVQSEYCPPLDGVAARIWELLKDQGCARMDTLASGLQIPVAEVSRHLMELEVDGHVCRRLDGQYERA